MMDVAVVVAVLDPASIIMVVVVGVAAHHTHFTHRRAPMQPRRVSGKFDTSLPRIH